ncbi:MAG: polyisoprenoid-binding protein [Gammaproteobacteria bacterium]|nr:MAG: polyisoprenoid-binding protein [Gammaproteobacteria bacterium]
MSRRLVSFLLLAFLATAPAVACDWLVVSGGSEVGFIAEQQGARFRGGFERFAAEVDFDPAAPTDGRIVGIVFTASVDTQNAERDDYLRSADWFASERWPEARFESRSIRAGDAPGRFVADGLLQIRDASREAAFVFDFQSAPGSEQARLEGHIDIQRLDYGVGQGEWRNTDWVGNDVRIEVRLELRRP